MREHTAVQHTMDMGYPNPDEVVQRKLTALNAILESWRDQFEEPPTVSFSFSAIDYTQLLLGDVYITDISNVSVENASFDTTHIFLDAVYYGKYFCISIVWEYDADPCIDDISLILYEAPSNSV